VPWVRNAVGGYLLIWKGCSRSMCRDACHQDIAPIQSCTTHLCLYGAARCHNMVCDDYPRQKTHLFGGDGQNQASYTACDAILMVVTPCACLSSESSPFEAALGEFELGLRRSKGVMKHPYIPIFLCQKNALCALAVLLAMLDSQSDFIWLNDSIPIWVC
jgi:hypothetical protein